MGANRKRKRQISFRVSDTEYENLRVKSERANLSTPQFCKSVALSKQIKEPTVDHAGAIQIAAELRKIGTNVNQIAKHLNTGENVVSDELQGQFERFEKELSNLWQQLS